MPKLPLLRFKSLLSSPLGIALIYLAAGTIWLGVANVILGFLPPHSIAINRFVFTCVTGLVLYLVAKSYARRLRESVKSEHNAAARARAFFQSASEAIIRFDADGVIRQMNPRAREMFGYEVGEAVGKPVEILIPQRQRERRADLRARFFPVPPGRPAAAVQEIVGLRKDGSEFLAEVSLSHVVNENSERIFAFISDVTERRAMKREARRAETLKALGSVAAAIAHELNNPLAVISSRIELMLSGGQELAPETRDDLLILQRNVERAVRISQNLLAMARQRPALREAVEINGAIEESVMQLFGESHDGSVRVDLALDPTLATVMGERTGFEQVILNLLTNAREAGAKRIRIETGSDPERAGWVRVVVSDDGAGAAPEVLARAFDPFYTTKEHGTGLGLWLSRRVIGDHGGTIEAKSEQGRGTSFVIRLPAAKLDAEPRAASALQ